MALNSALFLDGYYRIMLCLFKSFFAVAALAAATTVTAESIDPYWDYQTGIDELTDAQHHLAVLHKEQNTIVAGCPVKGKFFVSIGLKPKDHFGPSAKVVFRFDRNSPVSETWMAPPQGANVLAKLPKKHANQLAISKIYIIEVLSLEGAVRERVKFNLPEDGAVLKKVIEACH